MLFTSSRPRAAEYMKEICKETAISLERFQLVLNLVSGFTFFPDSCCRNLTSLNYDHSLATVIIVQSVQLSRNSNGTIEITHIHEPRHEISNNVVCATTKGSDQPAHMRSLVRVFAIRLSI